MTRDAAVLSLAPGDPDGLRALARAAERTGGQLERSASRLRAVGASEGVWTGHAAQACRLSVDELQAQLRDAASALRAAHTALMRFATELDEAQRVARRLVAERRESSWQEPATAFAATMSHDARERELREHLRQRSLVAERAVRAAAAAAPRGPSWLDRVDGVLREFVVEHARAVEILSLVLSVASAVAASFGLVPVAALLAGSSLACSYALYRYDDADEGELVLALAGAMTFGAGTAAVGAGKVAAWAVPAGRVRSAADLGGWGVNAFTTGDIAGELHAERRRSRPGAGGRAVVAPCPQAPARAPDGREPAAGASLPAQGGGLSTPGAGLSAAEARQPG